MPAKAKSKTSFAQHITQIRKMKGLTQEELAKLSGISRRVIAHYETLGKHPTAENVVRLSKALNISIDQFLGRKSIKIKESLNKRVIHNAKMLDNLSPSDKKTVLKMIETLNNQKSKS